MMFVDSIQQMSTQVARMMNVPAYYISADVNSSFTYANVQDERRQFVSLSLAPYVHAIQDRLSMDDITARGNIVKFDVEKTFLAVDALERLNVLEKMLALGLITVEQAMEMEDLTPNGNNDAPNVLE
jgi:phage portal protein BeeE